MIRASSIFRTPAPPRTECDACAPFGVGNVSRDASGAVHGVSPHYARHVHSFYVRVGAVPTGGGRFRNFYALVRYGTCERGEAVAAEKLVKVAMRQSAAGRA